MNKQELIEKIRALPYDEGVSVDTLKINRAGLIKLIDQLDEPKEVVVPQFVADWYEEYKDNLEYNIWDWMKYNLEPKKRENVIFSRWLGKTANNPVETLVKMKLYGYTVEKEPKYTVKIKSVNQYLVRNTDEDFLGFLQSRLKSKFTRKELEEAGFDWVFDCTGIEIEEVKG